MDSHRRFQGVNMHHKSLNILIQRYFSKFLLINDFDLVGGWKGFFGDVSSLGELFFSELDVNITKSNEAHA